MTGEWLKSFDVFVVNPANGSRRKIGEVHRRVGGQTGRGWRGVRPDGSLVSRHTTCDAAERAIHDDLKAKKRSK